MSIFTWLKGIWRRRFDEQDFQEEIRAHIAIAEAERMAEGADPKTAHEASLKDFGNVTLTREAAHKIWTPRWIDAVHDYIGDIRYALRALAKNPAFSLTIIIVLTVGIALNASVFTMLKSIELTPLGGVEKSAQLNVIFGETSTGRDLAVSYPDYQYLRDHDTAFAGLLGSRLITPTLGRGRSARPAWGEIVSANYFQVLGVHAQRGRTLLPSDEGAVGRPPIVVISDRMWRTDLGSDPDVIGKTIELNNVALSIVGVADASFHGTIVSYDVELFVPVTMGPQLGLTFTSTETTPAAVLADRRASVFYVMGRLRPGVTLASASTRLNTLWTELAKDRPATDIVKHISAVPFWKYPGSAQTIVLPMLMVLSAMGLLVLTIACANIAGLVVVRGMSRRGEIALRLALGATRARIVRLLIIENLVLAIPGAILGVWMAARAIPVLVSEAEALAAPARLFFNIQTDSIVVGFSVLVACGSALIFGFVPALRSSRVDLVSVMKEESTRGSARARLRSGLVIAQVAVSLLLIVGAGLVRRSLDAAQHADRGFDPEHVTAVSMDLKANGYDETRGRLFYRHLLDAARAKPGVETATLALYTPLTFPDTRTQRAEIEGRELRKDEDFYLWSNVVAPDYFRTLRVGVVGREFLERDDESSAQVAIVNTTLAERFLGGASNAVGKKIRLAEGGWRTIVGVAANVKYSRIDEAPKPYVYVPFMQSYRSGMILHTRGTAPIDGLVDQARETVASIDAELPIVYAKSLDHAAAGAMIFYRFMAMMLFVFGLTGMGLAALGTYGLVSYTVRQSTHEIGIRMALGASARSIVRAFVSRGMRLGAIGTVIGAVIAVSASRLLSSVLFGVSATDIESFAIAFAIVLGGVAAATLLPAWRASRTDPLKALRHQ